MRLPLRATLFPYTTLFRSQSADAGRRDPAHPRGGGAAGRAADAGAPPQGVRGTAAGEPRTPCGRSEEHTSELQSRVELVCRLLLEKKKEEGGVDGGGRQRH